MTDCLQAACAGLVSVATRLSPMPAHPQGLVVAYGDDLLMRQQFEYRGYDPDAYLGGVAVMSPAMRGG